MKTPEKIKLRNKLYKERNKDKILFCQKKYRERNKDKIALYEKLRHQRPEVKKRLRKNVLRHYYKNRDKQIELMKNWRNNNKEWFKKWRDDNLIKKRIYQIEYQNRTPQNIMIHRLRTRLRFALNNYTRTGKILKSRKYGINYQKIIEHLKPFPENLSKYHIDHIKPLSSFNLNDPEQIKIAFAPENHQWLLAFDNLSKNNKIL